MNKVEITKEIQLYFKKQYDKGFNCLDDTVGCLIIFCEDFLKDNKDQGRWMELLLNVMFNDVLSQATIVLLARESSVGIEIDESNIVKWIKQMEKNPVLKKGIYGENIE